MDITLDIEKYANNVYKQLKKELKKAQLSNDTFKVSELEKEIKYHLNRYKEVIKNV